MTSNLTTYYTTLCKNEFRVQTLRTFSFFSLSQTLMNLRVTLLPPSDCPRGMRGARLLAIMATAERTRDLPSLFMPWARQGSSHPLRMLSGRAGERCHFCNNDSGSRRGPGNESRKNKDFPTFGFRASPLCPQTSNSSLLTTKSKFFQWCSRPSVMTM